MMHEAVDAHWYTDEMMLTCTNSTYAASKGTAYSCSVSCWCNTRRLFCCLRKCKQAAVQASQMGGSHSPRCPGRAAPRVGC